MQEAGAPATLTLSSRDVDHVAEALNTLLSPLDYETEAAWGAAVSYHVRKLIGCDRTGFVLNQPERTAMVGYWDPQAARVYMERWYKTMVGDARRRARGLTSWVRADVWEFKELREGAYYHEWCIPNGNQDSAGMCVYQSGGHEVALYANDSSVGRFPRAGREAHLLRILQPALAAGLAALSGLSRVRADSRILDRVAIPVGIFDADGRLVHAVPALAALLSLDDVGPLLLAAARALVTAAGLPPTRSELAVVTPRGRYTLHLSLVESDLLGRSRLRCVTIAAPPAPREAREMQERYSLTTRETQVACLLADGSSNRKIARTLGISEHTARRHTERILHKLGVASRAEAAARLAS
jgi:DNA-binding NarL/FixJ family response regulator